MDRPGEKLKRVRERLKLTYRDVEAASQQIADRRGSDEFSLALSRLADIENKGTVPTIYRLFTLCAIYRLDFEEVLKWYGVPLPQLASESLRVGLKETHTIETREIGVGTVPLPPDFAIDLDKTTFLNHLIRRWGKMPLAMLNGLDLRLYRYGFIGLEDWSMYPLLRPGSLVAIDESRRKLATAGWTDEFDRPIYFFEHRDGFSCGWGALTPGRLVIQPHPASQQPPKVFDYPAEIDVIGQVVGVAILLERKPNRDMRPSVSANSTHS